MSQKNNLISLLLLLIVLSFCVMSHHANAEQLTNQIMINSLYWDFSQGMPDHFDFYSTHADLFSMDDSSGHLRIHKPADTLESTFKKATINPNMSFSGDFDIRVDYEIFSPLTNGDQLELQIISDSFIFFVVRSNEPGLGGQNVHVYTGSEPDGIQPNPGILTNDMKGILRVVRINTHIMAFFQTNSTEGFQLIFEKDVDDREVNVELALQNQPLSNAPLDAAFDNLRCMKPILYMFVGQNRYLQITDGQSPFSISLSNSQIMSAAISGDGIVINGQANGTGEIIVSDNNGHSGAVTVQILLPGSISGRVTDQEGHPFPYMRIEYSNENFHSETETNGHGEFIVTNVPPGKGRLRVIPEPNQPIVSFLEEIFLEEGQNLNIHDIHLLHGTLVTGLVYTPDGQPVVDRHFFSGEENPFISIPTDHNGVLMIYLPEGEWHLKMVQKRDDDFGLMPTVVHVSKDAQIINLGQLNTFAYNESTQISGKISNYDQMPCELQVVAFLEEEKITAENVDRIEPLSYAYPNSMGEYALFTPNDYTVRTYLVCMLNNDNPNMSVTILDEKYPIHSPQTNNDFSVVHPGYRVSGQNMHQGQPVTNGWSVLYQVPDDIFLGFAGSNHDGQFVFEHVLPGMYRIISVADKAMGGSEPFTVTDDMEVPPIDIQFMGDKYLYDDFNHHVIYDNRWQPLEKVGTINEDGEFISVIRSSGPVEHNMITLASPEHVNALACDVRIEGLNLDNESAAFAGLMGTFYQTKISSNDIQSDVIAGIAIGNQGENLMINWFLDKLIDPEQGITESVDSGTLSIKKIDIQKNYRIEINYDENQTFTFSIADSDHPNTIFSKSVTGPIFSGSATNPMKGLFTRAQGHGMIVAAFDNVTINQQNDVYDSFDNRPLDFMKWNNREIVRCIKEDHLILSTHAIGEKSETPIIIPGTKPFIESSVIILSDSYLSNGAKGQVQLAGYFYNDTFDQTSEQALNGREGNVWAKIFIDAYPDQTLTARCSVEISANSDHTQSDILFAQTFNLPIVHNKPFAMSIRLLNNRFVFNIIDQDNQKDNSIEYLIDTPMFPPIDSLMVLKTSIHAELGEGGYIVSLFDDVFVSDRMPMTGMIHGQVRDNNGAVLPSIHVYVFKEMCVNETIMPPIETDENGQYTMSVPEGKYYILAKPEKENDMNYLPQWWTHDQGTVKCNEAMPIEIHEDSFQADFILQSGFRINGTVYDPQGNPLSNACVGVMKEKCSGDKINFNQTNENGEFSFIVPEGDYFVGAWSTCDKEEQNQFVNIWWDNVLNCEQASPVTVNDEQPEAMLSFTLQTGGMLSGKIKNQRGEPIPGIRVGAHHIESGQWREVISLDDGQFVLSGLAEGYIHILIRPDIQSHLIPWEGDGFVKANEQHFMGDIVLHHGAIVTGILQNHEGMPLPDMRLNFGGPFEIGNILTHENGVFAVCLPPANWYLYLDEYYDKENQDVTQPEKEPLYLFPVHVEIYHIDEFINLGEIRTYDCSTDNRISGVLDIQTETIGQPEVIVLPENLLIEPKIFASVQPIYETKPNNDNQFEVFVPAGKLVNVFLAFFNEEDNGETLTIVDRIQSISAPKSGITLRHYAQSHIIHGSAYFHDNPDEDWADILLFKSQDKTFVGFTSLHADGSYHFYNVPPDTYQVAVWNRMNQQAIWSDIVTVTADIQVQPIEFFGIPMIPGDANQNGKIDVMDAVIILQKCATIK